jgi:hypothetical protein
LQINFCKNSLGHNDCQQQTAFSLRCGGKEMKRYLEAQVRGIDKLIKCNLKKEEKGLRRSSIQPDYIWQRMADKER